MTKNDAYIHSSSEVSEKCKIGEGSKIWHFSHIREGATIGKNVTIGQNVYIDKDVEIGDNCKIQNNVSIYKGVKIDNNVFIGPSVVFTNDVYPIVDGWSDKKIVDTHIKNDVSLGANSTILAGITIGEFTLVGAGSVVTKSLPSNCIVYGNPAKIKSEDYRKE
jgi:UDP-2-acetamido-3-amino-2,3-dideoxy-glucuronate N-acetyltransferase|tara:strand:+ start:301 stop:789 length:489 start_codon:yes stop_codon:yes gene_type:complete